MNWKEKDFEERHSEEIDSIYRASFPIQDIIRSKRGSSKDILKFDKEYGIDTILTLWNGTKITIQEKLRTLASAGEYRDICFEFMNDNVHKGEWFNGIAQMYFVGFVDENTDKIVEWYFIDTVQAKIILASRGLEELNNIVIKNALPRKANFLAVPISDIRKAVILHYNYSTNTNKKEGENPHAKIL